MTLALRPGPRGTLAIVGGLFLVVAMAAPTLAAAPTVTTVAFHRDGPLFDCPSFTLHGEWDVARRITVFSDGAGTPTSDLVHVEFDGTLYNPSNGKSVPDFGVRDFHDQLAPDGSFLSTIFTFERTDPFVHEAGQIQFGPADADGNQALLRVVGDQGFNDATIAQLCAALA